MSGYTNSASDLKSLIGQQIYSGYQQQEQDRLLLEFDEPISCYFCNQAIEVNEPINLHHTIYKSDGGTHVEPAHERCHVEFHSRKGDFRNWGKLSSLTRAWAFNLKNVKDHPAYEFDRQYYLMLYAG
jgi:hypothetical protein